MSSHEQIAAHIESTKALTVSPSWLDTFLASNSSRNIPVSALTQTALFRILASDIRETLSATPHSLLPVDIFDPTVQERRLHGPIPVQVLDIEDIGTSLWSQVEAIERVERGEAIRGREIVRTVAVDEDPEAPQNGRTSHSARASAFGLHRVIVQDAASTKAVAIEMQRIEGIAVDKLSIGTKLVLRNATVARGMVLLNPECVTMLGGKIEAQDRSWREGRKARLLQRITEIEGEQTSATGNANGRVR